MKRQSTCCDCGAAIKHYANRANSRCRPCYAKQKSTPESFWSRVDRSSDCWLWTGAIDENGYGVLNFDRKPTRAHVVAWKLAFGSPPKGLQVCHTCDVKCAPGDIGYRRCCNPAHLFLGTFSENIKDAAAKGRMARGERSNSHKRSRLTPADVQSIRASHGAGASTRTLADAYGVDIKIIQEAVSRRKWKWLSEPAATEPSP